jgi:hypothetical protein
VEQGAAGGGGGREEEPRAFFCHDDERVYEVLEQDVLSNKGLCSVYLLSYTLREA